MATIAADAITTMGTIETTVTIDTTVTIEATLTTETIVNELQKITNLGIV